MLCARMENKTVLPEGALITVNDIDIFLVNMIKGLGLSLDALPRETLYLLQDAITLEMCARESFTIQILSEKRSTWNTLVYSMMNWCHRTNG